MTTTLQTVNILTLSDREVVIHYQLILSSSREFVHEVKEIVVFYRLCKHNTDLIRNNC